MVNRIISILCTLALGVGIQLPGSTEKCETKVQHCSKDTTQGKNSTDLHLMQMPYSPFPLFFSSQPRTKDGCVCCWEADHVDTHHRSPTISEDNPIFTVASSFFCYSETCPPGKQFLNASDRSIVHSITQTDRLLC